MSSNLISRSSGQQTRKGFVAIQKNSPFFLPRYLMVGYLGFYFIKALRTLNVLFFVYEISESGYVIGFNYIDEGIRSSYGIAFAQIKNSTFALRSSASTTVRSVLARVVTPATTTIWVSWIPTGGK